MSEYKLMAALGLGMPDISQKTIFLHVGHGKTGSSYIQSALARSVSALNEAGISYPIRGKLAKLAHEGQTTSGNVLVDPKSFRKALRLAGKRAEQPHILFSSEALFDALIDTPVFDMIQETLPEHRIKLLLFIRNPLDHAISAYQQMAKAEGFQGDFAEFVARYQRMYSSRRLVEIASERNANIVIKNYSRQKDNLLKITEEFLGLEQGTLDSPVSAKVNRSMTRAEIELQKAFNRHYGKSSIRFVSNPLARHLPDMETEPPIVSREEMQDFLQRMENQAAECNPHIPPSEAYHVPSLEEAMSMVSSPDSTALYSFTSEQFDILARSISQAMEPKEILITFLKKILRR